MEQSKIDMFVATNMDKFPPMKVEVIKEQLKKLSDDKSVLINSISYKDPTTMLIISLFLGSWGGGSFLTG